MSQKLKYIDLFAGIGGFHIAFNKLKADCVFSSEWNKGAKETYFNNFKQEPLGDITKIDEKEIPNHDILCAGFPCQAFSISGKGKGFDDTRGTLFFDIVRIAKEKKPKVLFLENVANLEKHDGGRTFRVIKEKLEKLGYKFSSKVLNAKDFGLAQNRRRIIMVASLKGSFDFEKVKSSSKKIKIKDILDNSQEHDFLDKSEYTILNKKIWKEQPSGLIFCGYRNKNQRKKGVKPNTEHLSRVHKQPNRIYHINGTHPTLSSQEVSGRYFIYDGKKVRKLTLQECYKLQGFPQSFKIHEKKSEAYRQVGNSVPVPMISAVAKQIIKQLFR